MRGPLNWCSKSLYKLFFCARCCRGSHVVGEEDDRSEANGSEADDSQVNNYVEVHALRPDINSKLGYPSNAIRTAKYTILSSIPCSLLHQFKKVSNCFFVLVMFIALIPGASPLNPYSAILPLFIVLTTGIIKDLWEDSKRRTADRRANAAIVYVLRYRTCDERARHGTSAQVIPWQMRTHEGNKHCTRRVKKKRLSDEDNGNGEDESNGEHEWVFVPVRSSDVHPGDLMLYRTGDEVKADCVILNSSLPSGVTYIDTSSLDGETNAKSRRAKLQTTDYLGTVDDIVDSAIYGRTHPNLTTAISTSLRPVASHPELTAQSHRYISRSNSGDSNSSGYSSSDSGTSSTKTLFSRDHASKKSALSNEMDNKDNAAAAASTEVEAATAYQLNNVIRGRAQFSPNGIYMPSSSNRTETGAAKEKEENGSIKSTGDSGTADLVQEKAKLNIHIDTSTMTLVKVIPPEFAVEKKQYDYPAHRIVSLYNTIERDDDDEDEDSDKMGEALTRHKHPTNRTETSSHVAKVEAEAISTAELAKDKHTSPANTKGALTHQQQQIQQQQEQQQQQSSSPAQNKEDHTSAASGGLAAATATATAAAASASQQTALPMPPPQSSTSLLHLSSVPPPQIWSSTSSLISLRNHPVHMNPSMDTRNDSLFDVLSYNNSRSAHPHAALSTSRRTPALAECARDEGRRAHSTHHSHPRHAHVHPTQHHTLHIMGSSQPPSITSLLLMNVSSSQNMQHLSHSQSSPPLLHRRHLTFDELLESRGELPVPHAICELSQRYESAHAQTSTAQSVWLSRMPCVRGKGNDTVAEEYEMTAMARGEHEAGDKTALTTLQWRALKDEKTKRRRRREQQEREQRLGEESTHEADLVNGQQESARLWNTPNMTPTSRTDAPNRSAAPVSAAATLPKRTASLEAAASQRLVDAVHAHPRECTRSLLLYSANESPPPPPPPHTLPAILDHTAREGNNGADSSLRVAPHTHAKEEDVVVHSGVEESGVVVLGSTPNADLSAWFGQLRMPHKTLTVALGIDQFLPRGCVIRNTSWVLALALYTGPNTKVLLNMRAVPHKSNTMNRRLNNLNVIFILLSQTTAIIMCGMGVWYNYKLREAVPQAVLEPIQSAFASGSGSVSRSISSTSNSISGAWYIRYDVERFSGVALFFWRYLSNFILVSFLIPLSLYVTIEINKAIQMYLIAQDIRLSVTDEKTGERIMCKPRTSELNSELGHVQYIFTDKTGTLTENRMTYVGGFVHGQHHDERLRPGGVGMRLLERIQELQAVPTTTTTSSPSPIVAVAATTKNNNNSNTVSPPREGSPHRSPTRVHFQSLEENVPAANLPVLRDTTTHAHDTHETDETDAKEPNEDAQAQQQHGHDLGQVKDSSHDTHVYNKNTEKGGTALSSADAAHVTEADPSAATLVRVVSRSAEEKSLMRSPSSSSRPLSVHPSRLAGRDARDDGRTQDNAHEHNALIPYSNSTIIHNINMNDDNINNNNSKDRAHSHVHSTNYALRSSPLIRGLAASHTHRSSHTHSHQPSHHFHDRPFVFHSHEEKRIEHEPDFRYLRALALCHTILCFDDPARAESEKGTHAADAATKTAESAAAAASRSSIPMNTHVYASVPPPPPPPLGNGNSAEEGKHEVNSRDCVDSTSVFHGIHSGVTDSRSSSSINNNNNNNNNNNRARYSCHYDSTNNDGNSNNYTENVSVDMNGGDDTAESWEALHQQFKNQFITRGKIYEGQSLDEVALVSAASSNGFCLARRTTKQIFIRALGRAMCYDIIAELEFTPQRKLMSILLRRNRADDKLLDMDEGDEALARASYYRRRSREGASAAHVVGDDDAVTHGAAPGGAAGEAAVSAPLTRVDWMSDSDAHVFDTSMRGWRSGEEAFYSTPEQKNDTKTTPTTTTTTTTAWSTGRSTADVEEEEDDVDDEQRPYLLLVKGSDSSMLEILRRSPQNAPHAGAATAALASSAASVSLSMRDEIVKPAGTKSSAPLMPLCSLVHAPAFGPVDASSPIHKPNSHDNNTDKTTTTNTMNTNNYHREDFSWRRVARDAAAAEKKGTEDNKSIEAMMRDLDETASLGLRTLVLGQRYLTEAEVRAWLPVYQEAQCTMQQRSEKLHAAYALLEHSVDCVGSTAVEDQLQAGVPETLDFFLRASIVVWMLTGDKRETAVTIAHTSGLVSAPFGKYVCHFDACNPHANENAAVAAVDEDGTAAAAAGAAAVMMEGPDSATRMHADGIAAASHAYTHTHPPHRVTPSHLVAGVLSPSHQQPLHMAYNRPYRSNIGAMTSLGYAPSHTPSRSTITTMNHYPGTSVSTHEHVPISCHGTVHAALSSVTTVPPVLSKQGGPMTYYQGTTHGNGTSTTNNYNYHTHNNINSNSTTTSKQNMTHHIDYDNLDDEQCNAILDAQFDYAEAMCREGFTQHVAKTVMIVVDGKTLDRIFADDKRAHRFFELSCGARCGVYCRMTPLQKAQVVRMFQRNLHATALAIGDGANDVSMIQESKIGVAIMGLEGSQAELASDYALPKFRCLKRLLMVHGRFSVYREAHCILYSLYKNVMLVVGLVGYSFFTAFSGLSFLDTWMLSLYSVTLCVLQPITLGTLNKDCEDELAESVPQLYPPLSRERMYFSGRYIAKWLSDGLVEGVLIFLTLIFIIGQEDDLFSFRSAGVADYGFIYFTLLIFVSNLRAGVTYSYGCVVLIVAFLVEMAILPVVQFIYSSLPFVLGSNDMVYVANTVYGGSSIFWMLVFLALVIFMLYTMCTNVYIQLFAPWENASVAMRASHMSSYRYMYLQPYLRSERHLPR